MNVTRTRLAAAAAAGAVVCAGAIATASTGHADPSISSSASGSASSVPASPMTPTSSGTATVPSQAHATVTPLLTYVGGNQVKAGYQVDGAVFAGKAGNAFDYTSDDIYIDGKPIDGGDGAPLGPDANLRQLHVTYRDPNPVTLAAGQHTMKVVFIYATGPTSTSTITAVKKFTLGYNPTMTPPAPSTKSSEPPTPSPVTTQLGVTG